VQYETQTPITNRTSRTVCRIKSILHTQKMEKESIALTHAEQKDLRRLSKT
jgi:hypothetical protein